MQTKNSTPNNNVKSYLIKAVQAIGNNKIVRFYVDGFKSMTIGKKLWLIIFIKLFIFFVLLKIFFFPNYLKTNFKNDTERSQHVIEQLTK